MAARAAAENAEALGVHAEIPGLRANDSDATAHVLHCIGDGDSGSAAVPDDEQGVALVEVRFAAGWPDVRVGPGRVPAAALNPKEARAVGLGGADDVKGQRQAVLVAVDDVRLDLGRVGGAGKWDCPNQQA